MTGLPTIVAVSVLVITTLVTLTEAGRASQLRGLLQRPDAVQALNLTDLLEANDAGPSGVSLILSSDFSIQPSLKVVEAHSSVEIRGSKASEAHVLWYLQASSSALMSMPAGTTLTLVDLFLKDAQMLQSSESFLQPVSTALEPGAQLNLSSVEITTSCRQLLEYQTFACDVASWSSAKTTATAAGGTLLVTPGLLRVVSWTSPSVLATDVNITCDYAVSGNNSDTAGVPPVPPCAVGSASSATELLAGLAVLQSLNSRVTMLLVDNVTLPYGTPAVQITEHVAIRNVPGGPMMELDLGLNVGLFVIGLADATGVMYFQDIVLVNLAVGPDEAFPSSMLTGALWAVLYDRQSIKPERLILSGVSLVIPPDLFSWLSWWANVQTSPWPFIRATAAWLEDFMFVSMKIASADDQTLTLSQRQGRGTQWVNNCTLMTRAWRTPSTLAATGISSIVPGDPYAPLSKMTGVASVTQLRLGLQNASVPYLVLLRNLTVTPRSWPTPLLPVAGNVTLIGRFGAQPVTLDLSNQANLMLLTQPMHLYRLVLLGAAPCGGGSSNSNFSSSSSGGGNGSSSLVCTAAVAVGDSCSSGAFASMLWAFNMSRPWTMLYLQDVTVVVPAAELAVLAQLTMANESRAQATMTAIGEALRSAQVLSSSNTSLTVGALNFLVGGQSWQDVQVLSGAATAYVPFRPVPAMPSSCDPFATATEPDGPLLQPWQIAVIVVAVLLLLALVGLVIYAVRVVRVAQAKGLKHETDMIEILKSSQESARENNSRVSMYINAQQAVTGGSDDLLWDHMATLGGISRHSPRRSCATLLPNAAAANASLIGGAAGSSSGAPSCSPHARSHLSRQDHNKCSSSAGSPASCSNNSTTPSGRDARAECILEGGQSGEELCRGVIVTAGKVRPAPSVPTSQALDRSVRAVQRVARPRSSTSRRDGSSSRQDGVASEEEEQYKEGVWWQDARVLQYGGDEHGLMAETQGGVNGPRLHEMQATSSCSPSVYGVDRGAWPERINTPLGTASPGIISCHPASAESPSGGGMSTPATSGSAQQLLALFSGGGNAAAVEMCRRSGNADHPHGFAGAPTGPAGGLNVGAPSAGVAAVEKAGGDTPPAPSAAEDIRLAIAALATDGDVQQVVVEQVVGQGTYGVVYKGRWRNLPVAVKRLLFQDVPTPGAPGNPQISARQRAISEAAISTSLSHPHIVNTFAYDLRPIVSNDGAHEPQFETGHADTPPDWRLYIIQEFCDSGPLSDAIDEGQFYGGGEPDLSKVLQVASDVAQGMMYIHSRNVIHGDLSAGNVLLTFSPRTASCFIAKVGDYGLSRKLLSNQTHISNAWQGTPYYMAPEVLQRGELSKAADVFSYGVILSELLTGKLTWRVAAAAQQQAAAMAAAAARQRQPASPSNNGHNNNKHDHNDDGDDNHHHQHDDDGNVRDGGHGPPHMPPLPPLQFPTSVPPALIALVQVCMYPHPRARPTFAQVLNHLGALQHGLLRQYGGGSSNGCGGGGYPPHAASAPLLPMRGNAGMQRVVISSGMSSAASSRG